MAGHLTKRATLIGRFGTSSATFAFCSPVSPNIGQSAPISATVTQQRLVRSNFGHFIFNESNIPFVVGFRVVMIGLLVVVRLVVMIGLRVVVLLVVRLVVVVGFGVVVVVVVVDVVVVLVVVVGGSVVVGFLFLFFLPACFFSRSFRFLSRSAAAAAFSALLMIYHIV